MMKTTGKRALPCLWRGKHGRQNTENHTDSHCWTDSWNACSCDVSDASEKHRIYTINLIWNRSDYHCVLSSTVSKDITGKVVLSTCHSMDYERDIVICMQWICSVCNREYRSWCHGEHDERSAVYQSGNACQYGNQHSVASYT